MCTRATVAAATNESYDSRNVTSAIRHLLEQLDPPLPCRVKRCDHVLVKVNMGCTGARLPEDRFTSHPAYVEAVIGALLDCGAKVSFGDDVARAGRYCESIYQRTGMRDVANRTGAELVDFVGGGAREVPSRLFFPRSYLVANAYFEADFVVNVANCRSHQGIGLSGAMKNMFGCVVGLRKQQIHNLFPCQPEAFSRAIADIYRIVQPDISFLDLTTVVEGAGLNPAVRPVGLILAGTDGIAIDALAAHAIGYEDLPLWIARYGDKFGLGCNLLNEISITGIEWESLHKPRLKYPWMHTVGASMYTRITARISNTFLRPRPVISPSLCTGCADCLQRCPVNCIRPASGNHAYAIDPTQCVDCGCCLSVCEAGAVQLEFLGLVKALRRALNRMPPKVDPKAYSPADPADTYASPKLDL